MCSINMEIEEKCEKTCGSRPKTVSRRSCQAQFKLYNVNNVDLGLQFQIFPFFHCIFMTSDGSVLCKSCFGTKLQAESLGTCNLHCQWLIWFLSFPAYIFINILMAANHRLFVYASLKSAVIDCMTSIYV